MQKNNSPKKYLVLFSFLFVTSCQPQKADNSNTSPSQSTELELCTTSTSYSPSSTLNGVATFSKRGLSVTTSPSLRFTLSGLVTGLPIRFAEIRVLNSSGSVIQCGRTNSTGNLKALDGVSDLKIPSSAGTYTVEVLARANYNPTPAVFTSKPAFSVLFSVKEDIYSNTIYKLSTTVSTTGAGTYSNVNLNGSGSETVSAKIEGGAFNIYNDIITSYEYLANHTDNQNISCLNPKMSVFWKAGFNPNQYIYPDNDPASLGTVSFYLRDEKELYINGGVLGNVASIDTDHFDDSVIIHELGHHIENVCGTMDSPGGSHSGSSRIDPRLAWSEGWGNFFGAHIIKNNINAINPNLSALLPNNEWLYYFDSDGYTDGSVNSGYEYLRFNLSRVGNVNTTETLYSSDGTGGYSFDPVSSTSNPGEGHFREVAISRALFKSTNSCTSNCINQDNFSDLWQSFEKTTQGMGQSQYPFRSSIRLLERFKAVKGGTLSGGLTSIFETQEAMQLAGSADYTTSGYTTWVPYGIKLVPSGSACSLKINPKANSNYKSDQRFSNHFYYIDKNSLPGVTNIKLSKTYVTGSTNLEIDLILFNESFRYNEDCNSSTCSRGTTSDVLTADRGSSYPKNISIASLSTSTKSILNVRVYTPSSVSSPTEYTYTLTDQNGGYLCPNTSF